MSSEQVECANRDKMNGCFFRQILRQNVSWFLSYHRKTLLLKLTERALLPLKTILELLKIALQRLTYFYMTVTETF